MKNSVFLNPCDSNSGSSKGERTEDLPSFFSVGRKEKSEDRPSVDRSEGDN